MQSLTGNRAPSTPEEAAVARRAGAQRRATAPPRLLSALRWRLLQIVLLYAGTACAGADDQAVVDAEGLWEYTGLVTRDGRSLPLTGVFLISKGTFLQQSIFDGEPFSLQGSMAHVGPYRGGGAGMRLTSLQTLSLDPTATDPLRSAGALEHDLAVTREGDELTLVFGGGTSTVQTFRHISDAEDTTVYAFADGALAFTGEYFILVAGDTRRAVTGYGRFTLNDDVLTLTARRWAASDGSSTINLRDAVITARFDEATLTLPGGGSFPVVPTPAGDDTR